MMKIKEINKVVKTKGFFLYPVFEKFFCHKCGNFVTTGYVMASLNYYKPNYDCLKEDFSIYSFYCPYCGKKLKLPVVQENIYEIELKIETLRRKNNGRKIDRLP